MNYCSSLCVCVLVCNVRTKSRNVFSLVFIFCIISCDQAAAPDQARFKTFYKDAIINHQGLLSDGCFFRFTVDAANLSLLVCVFPFGHLEKSR